MASPSTFSIRATDGSTLEISKEALEMSVLGAGTLRYRAFHRQTLDSPVEFDVSRPIAALIVAYCEKWHGEAERISADFGGVSEEEAAFFGAIDREDLVALILAADYVNVPRLYAHACKAFHWTFIRRKRTEEIREALDIECNHE